MMRSILVGILIVVALAVGWMTFDWYRAQHTAKAFGAPFELVQGSGEPITQEAFKGHPSAVFFGFTHCPEVCPTTLWEMSEALKALGPDADKLKVLFISIDPTRDDPEALALYLQSFDPRIVGLTGSEEEIGTVAASYRAYWRKVPTGDGDYTMDHTASIYLMDADGEFTSTISYDEHADMRLAKLKKLLAGGVS